MADYFQRGESLDYTNPTENLIPQDTVVVIGSRIGIAGCPIPPGKTGSLHVVGVFALPMSGTAAVEMGQNVYFDGTGITDEADDGSGNDYTPAGYAAAPAAAGDETILVKLCG